MKETKEKERRDVKRVPIRVLVNCLPLQMSSQRNGHAPQGWEMWAKNLGDDGVGLKWSLAWASGRCPHCLKMAREAMKETRRPALNAFCQCVSPAESLKEGEEIMMDGLVYDDDGSHPMRGRIQWVRYDKRGKTAEFGIHVTTPEHRDYFRTLEEA
jgi:hypothetical protein